jgi:predicted ATP-dependent serine protease
LRRRELHYALQRTLRGALLVKYRCDACGKDADERSFRSGFCMFCGASAVVAVEEEETDGRPKRGSTARIVSGAEIGTMDPLIPTKAPIFACIGGYGRGTLVAVTAPPGHGKTTECLRVPIAQNARVIHAVAGEMSEPQGVEAAFDAGATEKYIRDDKYIFLTADDTADALEEIDRLCSTGKKERRPQFVIWDSTSMWLPNGREEEEKEFVSDNVALAEEHGLVIFAIAQWSQEGRGKGSLIIPHGGALWMEVHNGPPGQFRVKKCRPPWSGKQGIYDRPVLKPGQTWEGQEIVGVRKKAKNEGRKG